MDKVDVSGRSDWLSILRGSAYGVMSNKGEGRSSADNNDQLIQASERAEDMAKRASRWEKKVLQIYQPSGGA